MVKIAPSILSADFCRLKMTSKKFLPLTGFM